MINDSTNSKLGDRGIAPGRSTESDVHAENEAPIDVVAEIGALPTGAIVTEGALARMFGRHPASIKRAVTRGELPAPARLLGGNSWTAGAIVRHIERRMDEAAKENERTARRLDALKP